MPIINHNELQRMTGGDQELLADLAVIFVRQLPELQARIRIGTETGNAAEIESCAHQLKSRVSYFGANELRQRIEKMEVAAGTNDTNSVAKMQRELKDDIQQLVEELRQLTKLELRIEE